MSCSFCERRGRGKGLPRGWKIYRDTVFCKECLRERYRIRSITMAVIEPTGAASQELWTKLEKAPRDDRVWRASFAEGQPVVRVLLGDRWWQMRVKCSRYGGQRAAYEKVASGAVRGEIFFLRVPTSRPLAHQRIMCRIVAWLPRAAAAERTSCLRC